MKPRMKYCLRIKVVQTENKLFFCQENLLLDRLDTFNYFDDDKQPVRITVVRRGKIFAKLQIQEERDERNSFYGFCENTFCHEQIFPKENQGFARYLLPQWFKADDVLIFHLNEKNATECVIWDYASSILQSRVYGKLGRLLLGKVKTVNFNDLIMAWIPKTFYRGKEYWVLNFTKLDK